MVDEQTRLDEAAGAEAPGHNGTMPDAPEPREQGGEEVPAAFELLAKTEELVTGHALGQEESDDQVTTRIFTVANIISLLRLCLVPVFVVLLLDGHNILATFVFAIAAGTDFIDGYLARSTNTVSRLGRVLDPAVDRILMITGVVMVYIVGRLPLWIIIVVLARDLMLLVGGGYLLLRYKVRTPVVFAGKLATTLFFVGLVGLLLNWPQIAGLGLVDISWLPGFNSEPTSAGIWFIYAGLVIALFTTIYYVASSLMKAGVVREQEASRKAAEVADLAESGQVTEEALPAASGEAGGQQPDAVPSADIKETEEPLEPQTDAPKAVAE